MKKLSLKVAEVTNLKVKQKIWLWNFTRTTSIVTTKHFRELLQKNQPLPRKLLLLQQRQLPSIHHLRNFCLAQMKKFNIKFPTFITKGIKIKFRHKDFWSQGSWKEPVWWESKIETNYELQTQHSLKRTPIMHQRIIFSPGKDSHLQSLTRKTKSTKSFNKLQTNSVLWTPLLK